MSWIAENTTHCYNWVCVYKGEESYQYKLVIWKFPSEDIWPICQDDQMLCILIIHLCYCSTLLMTEHKKALETRLKANFPSSTYAGYVYDSNLIVWLFY